MDGTINIAEYIPFGANNAIKRNVLVDLLGCSDREVRRMIEVARQEGAVILNFSDGKGYFRPEKKEEVEKYIRQEEARAKSIFFNLKSAKIALRKIEGQLTMDDF